MTTFETLGLSPALLRALAETDYTTPTPIQEQAIPLILGGHDVLGGAQTGTGKTAAFGLPLLQRLAKETPPKGPRKPRALILVPTRELAVQVADNLKTYGRHLRMNVTTIFGGAGMQPQIDNLRRGVDVLIACPSRLLDHMDSGHAKLDAVELLVLDEADRMLDMGFLPSIKRVLARVPQLDTPQGRHQIDAMVALANLTRKGFAVGDLSILMSPRTVITWAENAQIFHDVKLAFELSFLNKCELAERAIVAEYFQRCFGQELTQPAHDPALQVSVG